MLFSGTAQQVRADLIPRGLKAMLGLFFVSYVPLLSLRTPARSTKSEPGSTLKGSNNIDSADKDLNMNAGAAYSCPLHLITGLAEVQCTWGGVFVAEATAALRPTWHLLLSDTDVAPTALFEVSELVTLCKNLVYEELNGEPWCPNWH